MAAADQVLQIVELLERIFEQLPAEDLPLVQRTSKLFKNVVDQSIILQRRLYLQPETAGELHRRWNHLFFQGLREYMPVFIIHGTAIFQLDTKTSKTEIEAQADANMFLTQPPTKQVLAVWFFEDSPSDDPITHSVEINSSDTGVTIGKLKLAVIGSLEAVLRDNAVSVTNHKLHVHVYDVEYDLEHDRQAPTGPRRHEMVCCLSRLPRRRG
ncbi:hypothetical protein LTR37_001463 [Vermiconidia calcicola]|uniref:Uncharacterized protein n=1 Tax=Vermiconidia calcicola TaxID=1690605 RepID=A0ACC3NVX9_9PEZI|nr:hypothetical protein LTR37_001463 [Vermiconidia calcicola]